MSWRSTSEAPPPSLGLIEASSIARGFEMTDAMLKAADVQLMMNRTICSGKYITLVAGELAEVQASMEAGLDVCRECTVDEFIIPDVHPDVFTAITSTSVVDKRGALGVIESFSVAALVEAIDRVAKEAPVEMVGCQLAMALGGKAYLVFTGDVDAVRYSIAAGAEVVSKRGLLVNQVVIPNPSHELFESII